MGKAHLFLVPGKALLGIALGTGLFAGASNAAIIVYNSLAAFNAATTGQATDTFAGFSVSSPTATPIVRSVGPYTYTAAAANDFFGAGTAGNPSLSTNQATDPIVINTFLGGVKAIGGNFYGSDINGAFAAGDITLTAVDGSGSVSQTIVGATTGSFLGFVSDGPMTSLTIASVAPASGFLWPTVDNLVLASSVAVPEPASLTLIAAGGLFLRRRRV